MYSIYKIKKEYPDVSLKTKIIIALLEDTKEMFVDRLYSMVIYDKFNIKLPGFSLQSMSKPLDRKLIPIINEAEKDVNLILEDCEIIDSVYNPTGVYKWCRSISNNHGEHLYENKIFKNDDGTEYTQKVYTGYKQNDDTHFILIFDNLNNLAEEKHEGKMLSKLETINLWSRDYCRLQITKHWKWTVLNVIQQAADSEKQQFDFKGNTIIEKIKPSLDGLGNSKECQRDHFVIFGWFAPARFGIESYPIDNGYDIEVMGDNFRSMIVLKSNLSQSNVEIPFYFDGAVSRLKELPPPSEMSDVYNFIRKIRK